MLLQAHLCFYPYFFRFQCQLNQIDQNKISPVNRKVLMSRT